MQYYIQVQRTMVNYLLIHKVLIRSFNIFEQLLFTLNKDIMGFLSEKYSGKWLFFSDYLDGQFSKWKNTRNFKIIQN